MPEHLPWDRPDADPLADILAVKRSFSRYYGTHVDPSGPAPGVPVVDSIAWMCDYMYRRYGNDGPRPWWEGPDAYHGGGDLP